MNGHPVPAGLVRDLAQVRVKLATLGERLHDTGPATTRSELTSIAEEAHTLWRMIRDLTHTEPDTGCHQHPRGPVDPQPNTERGETKCLLCNNWRRRGQQPPRRRTLAEINNPEGPPG